MELNHLEQKAQQASTLLKAMSNQSRLLILCQLNEGEKSVPYWQAFFVGEYPGHLHAAAALLLVSQ